MRDNLGKIKIYDKNLNINPKENKNPSKCKFTSFSLPFFKIRYLRLEFNKPSRKKLNVYILSFYHTYE